VARLPRAFFARPSLEVAPELIGQVLARRLDDGTRLSARIVEVEAYDELDPASHSFRGRTPRTDVMFGTPGRLYVYFTYGMHWCMNVVTGRAGEGSAVLLRAAEPLEGLEAMTARRGPRPPRELLAGPARWTRAFGIDGRDDGADLVRGAAVWLERGERVPSDRVAVTARIGVTVATERPWRFVDAASRCLSRPLPRVSPSAPRRR